MMATISVELDEADIRKACEYWATHRILNQGHAVSCDLSVVVCNGQPTGTINKITVFVETDSMKKDSDYGR